MTFDEFWLDLIPAEDGFRVSVRESPSGEVPPYNARLPAAEGIVQLAAAFEGVRSERDFHLSPAPEKSLERRIEEVGDQLGAALFSPQLREIWGACHGTGVRRERPVRVRLQMEIDEPGGARLHALPWECLRVPGDGFAAVDSSTSLVRYVRLRGRDRAPARPRRLEVLVVAAQAPALPRLDLDGEIEALLALEGAGLHFDVLDDPSVESIAARFADGPVHVLHFLGHGGFDADERRGVLFLRGGAVPGELLADALQPARHLRLVVLNACRTAVTAEGAAFAGVATALIRGAGVPAVVAMQYPIPDSAAIVFARAVYERLAAGAGLDHAIGEGRRRLRFTGSPAWVVPVLFSRLEGGELFAAEESRFPAGLKAAAAAGLALLLGLAVWLGAPRLLSPVEPGETAINHLADLYEDDPGEGEPGSGEDDKPAAAEEKRTEGQTASPQAGKRTVPARHVASPSEGEERREVAAEPPPPATPDAHTLSCGDSIRFAAVDAHAACTLQEIDGERFVTLRLTYGGRTGTAAVLAAGEVTFGALPEVVLPVLDLDLESGQLRLLPPRISGQ